MDDCTVRVDMSTLVGWATRVTTRGDRVARFDRKQSTTPKVQAMMVGRLYRKPKKLPAKLIPSDSGPCTQLLRI